MAAAEPLAARLTTRWLGRAMRLLPDCGSTNDEAAAWARAGAPHGAVVIADAQRAGRGRFGRAWDSPVGADLYFSTVLRPKLAPREAPPLTLAAAVAVAEALASFGARPELKWPNDVLLDGRKVAGILCEMAAVGPPTDRIEHVVVGIGVNLGRRAFPEELVARATSLALAVPAADAPDLRDRFVVALCASLERWHDALCAHGPGPIATAWKPYARLFGRGIEIDDGRRRIAGIAEDLDGDGALLLRLPDGSRARVVAGEIAPEAAQPTV